MLPPNHYLSAAIFYLFQHFYRKWRPAHLSANGGQQPDDRSRHRQAWPQGFTRQPVGFKMNCGWIARWFSWSAASRSASYLCPSGRICLDDGQRRNRAVFIAGGGDDRPLPGRDPGEIYRELTREFGEPLMTASQAPATPDKRPCWRNLHPSRSRSQSWRAKKSRLSSHARRATTLPSAVCDGQDRMVGGASVRDREYLQDLRGELSGGGAFAPHPWRKCRRL